MKNTWQDGKIIKMIKMIKMINMNIEHLLACLSVVIAKAKAGSDCHDQSLVQKAK